MPRDSGSMAGYTGMKKKGRQELMRSENAGPFEGQDPKA